MHVFLYWVEKIETNINLEQPINLPTKTVEYGGSMFGTKVA